MSADFLDTNLFVYLFDQRDPQKQSRAAELIHGAIAGGNAIISAQVVQETLNVITRKLPVPAKHEDAAQFLRDLLLPLWRINPTPRMFERGLEIQHRYGFSFYDGMILAAALEGGCRRLMTEDLQHGQVIDGLTITNPFVAAGPH